MFPRFSEVFVIIHRDIGSPSQIQLSLPCVAFKVEIRKQEVGNFRKTKACIKKLLAWV